MDLPKSKVLWDRIIKKRLKATYWVILVKRRPWVKWALLMPLFLGLTAFAYMYFYDNLKDDMGRPINWDKIKNKDFKKSTILRDQNDQIIYRLFFEVRDPIKENEVPKILIDSFVAAEDENFWIHPGIDPSAISRAFVGNSLRWFGINLWSNSGGSTITQQLVRLIYSGEVAEFHRRDQTLWRKIREAHFAIQLEKRYTKKEILTAFLNMIYFGNGAHGVAEAYRYYFGKDIRENKLTPCEVAILVSLNKGSAKYNPIFREPAKPNIKTGSSEEEVARLTKEYENKRDKEKIRIAFARGRYNWVLEQMLEESVIDEDTYRNSLFDEKGDLTELADLKITPFREPGFGHAARMVKETTLGMNFPDYEIMHHGGLQIKTCIDSQIQKILNETLTPHLAELNKEIDDKTNPIDGSAAIIEVKTGCLVALFGSHSYTESPFNRLMTLRSVGSGFKPFVYGAAFEYAGKKLDDQILNAPLIMRGANGKQWNPQNFEEKRPVPDGYIPLAVGQIRSVNRPTIRLAHEIGMDRIVLFAHKLGVWGNYGIVKDPDGKIIFRMPGVEDQGDRIIPLLPTAIGASDLNLIELINAYAVLFRGGSYLPPKLILKISDFDGNVKYEAPQIEPTQQISKETAIKELILLRATTEVGTAKISMRNNDQDQQYAIKTGTSNNPNHSLGDGPGDVGMYGGRPDLVMGMRIGHDIPKPIVIPRFMKKASGQADMKVSGGWVAGGVTRQIWDRILLIRPKVEFPPEVENGLTELLANYPDKYK